MYTLLLFIVVGIIAAIVASNTSDNWSYEGLNILATVISWFCGVIALLMVIFIPIELQDRREGIVMFEAYKETVQASRKRKDITDLERATILKDVAEYNAKLAKAKYLRTTQWKWWTPEEVETVKPIE